jgi:hypothetical protein
MTGDVTDDQTIHWSGAAVSISIRNHFEAKARTRTNLRGKLRRTAGIDIEGGVYLLPFGSWKVDRSTIADGPDMNWYAVFARATFSFGQPRYRKPAQK